MPKMNDNAVIEREDVVVMSFVDIKTYQFLQQSLERIECLCVGEMLCYDSSLILIMEK